MFLRGRGLGHPCLLSLRRTPRSFTGDLRGDDDCRSVVTDITSTNFERKILYELYTVGDTNREMCLRSPQSDLRVLGAVPSVTVGVVRLPPLTPRLSTVLSEL